MAGLVAARSLAAGGSSVLVLERSDHVGGRLYTVELGGGYVDMGAGFFTGIHRRTLALIQAMGLEDDLVRVSSRGAVLTPDAVIGLDLLRLPSLLFRLGWYGVFGIGRQLLRVLVLWRGCDPAHPERLAGRDTMSIDEFACRAVPPSVMNLLLVPGLRGFLYWDPRRASAAMLDMLTRAALTFLPFRQLRRGMSSLADAVARDLDVRLGCDVIALERLDGGWSVRCRDGGGQQSVACSAVVLATPAGCAARLLPEPHEAVRQYLEKVVYSSATVTAVVTARRMPGPWSALLVQPAVHPRLVLASPLSVRTPEAVSADGDVLVLYEAGTAVDDVDVLISALPECYRAEPVATATVTWPEAVPECTVGHLRALAQLDVSALADDGIALAGDYMHTPYVEGAVRSGEAAAQLLLIRRLRTRHGDTSQPR